MPILTSTSKTTTSPNAPGTFIGEGHLKPNPHFQGSVSWRDTFMREWAFIMQDHNYPIKNSKAGRSPFETVQFFSVSAMYD